jgi:septal ring factor EnvC (AmiA/AmiB activator)
VLAALQRMGLNPPPAILVRPEDALAAVRSAILLGAVVPEIRTETELLAEDLAALKRITASIGEERDRLTARIAEQETEKMRLSRLLAEREKLREQSEAVLEEERRKSEILAARAGNLEELIKALERQLEERRREEEERRRQEEEVEDLPVPPANRLTASRPFGELTNSLILPVAGRIVHRFGTEDQLGGTRNGDTVQTQSGAIVTTPCDATVLYSGPFRSYGQLLILDAGDGYHIVMAGLDRINVQLGQNLLAGEPVGAMAEVQLASADGVEAGNAGPKLYIELRKDGNPIDPAPWWVDREAGRTGNDS